MRLQASEAARLLFACRICVSSDSHTLRVDTKASRSIQEGSRIFFREKLIGSVYRTVPAGRWPGSLQRLDRRQDHWSAAAWETRRLTYNGSEVGSLNPGWKIVMRHLEGPLLT